MAESNALGPNYRDIGTANDSLRAEIEQLRAENRRLHAALERYANTGQRLDQLEKMVMDGKAIGPAGQGRDKMVQETVADSLKYSEQRFRDFAELGADILWEVDASFKYTFDSDTFESYTGIPASQRIGVRRGQVFLVANKGSIKATEQWRQHCYVLSQHAPFDDFQFEYTLASGEVRHIRSSGRPIFDHNGRFMGYRGIDVDVTEHQKLLDTVTHQAQHDELTGLANRTLFRESCERALHRARRHDSRLAILYVDVDRFKQVNDGLGHAVGDRLLCEIAARLTASVRSGDLVARLGGDEFAILLEPLAAREDATVLVDRLSANIYRPFSLKERTINVSGSMGISVFPEDGTEFDTLLKHADVAMYRAKQSGRNCYRQFTPEMNERV